MTRDSAVLLTSLLSSLAVFLGSHFGLLQEAFGLGPVWQSRIELFSGLLAMVAGWLRMSPLALSAAHPMALAPETTLDPFKPSDKQTA